jgi:benzoyl-CoA-dihydrodiol lyase
LSENSARSPEWVTFQTNPSQYRHISVTYDGAVATLTLKVDEHNGHRKGYELKLNSYDITVDVELADAIQRMRFEHPDVTCVIVTSGLEGIFSSGANIFMLGTSSHGFKVNFCKYTNETRLYIEDAHENSGQTYIAALNGITSGGGYELPLACEEIYLIDDRTSAVSLPEIPFLGVLPGTGGLTRMVDKRNVRRDRADIFVTLAEGFKGKRAADWNIVDGVFKRSKFDDAIQARAKEVANGGRPDRKGISLSPIHLDIDAKGIHGQYVDVQFTGERVATLTITGPENLPEIPANPADLGCDWWALHMWRELDEALLNLRFNYREIGLLLLRTQGDIDTVLKLDEQIMAHKDDWFVNEVIHHQKRVLKRLDLMSKSLFALLDEGSCFAGSLFELTISADRSYMLEEDVEIAISPMNGGVLLMANGLSRLQTRFVMEPALADVAAASRGHLDSSEADDLGLVTMIYDDIDWDDEIRMIVEERSNYSPDALTAMEASIRFAGPETMETKIFGRLSAWQNWCFQRPNAVGKEGALKLYGQPQNAVFSWERT